MPKLLDNVLMNLKPDIKCSRLSISYSDNVNKGDSIEINADGEKKDYIVKKMKQNKSKMTTTLWLKSCQQKHSTVGGVKMENKCCDNCNLYNYKTGCSGSHGKECNRENPLGRIYWRPKTDNAISPKHYTALKISPLEYIHANNLDWNVGNVVKYVSRYKMKNGIEDLKKAQLYLADIIENEESKCQ